jgi:multiple sugar transport system permease protein
MKHTKQELEIIKKIKKSSDKLGWKNRLLINIALFISFVFFICPVLWVLLISFKTQDQITNWPPDVFKSFTIENYESIFSRIFTAGSKASGLGKELVMQKKVDEYVRAYLNTTLYSTASVLISLIIGVPAAYGLARYKTKTKETLASMFMGFRFVPDLMTIIPTFLIYQAVGLYNTYFGLIWIYLLISLPMIIWITMIGFDEIPFDLEQAAILDGYSRIKAFFKIILPIAKPSIAAATVLSFIYAWNNFIFGFILTSVDKKPVTYAILSFYDITGLNFGRIAAAIILAILPAIIVSQIAANYLVSGLSMGAVKR